MIEVNDLIGIPFKKGGRGPEVYDCYGLVMELKRREGVILPDYRTFDRIDKAALVLAGILNAPDSPWRECEWKPGAVPVFNVAGWGSHVGYALDTYNFIHVWGKLSGVSRDKRFDWERANKIMGVYEYVG